MIALSESVWVVWSAHLNPRRFFHYAGVDKASAPGVLGWISALLVIIGFVHFSRRLPSVRDNLFRLSWLKVLAVLVAVASGFCEEMIFRKWLMDLLQHKGYGPILQVAGSALAFGLVHAVWGLMRGSLRAGLGAMIATGGLGLALALVYVASHRIVLPYRSAFPDQSTDRTRLGDCRRPRRNVSPINSGMTIPHRDL